MQEMVSATRVRPQSFQRQSREESRLDFSISENKRSSDGACEGSHLGGDASVAPTSATSAVSGPGVMPLQKVTLFRKTMDGDDSHSKNRLAAIGIVVSSDSYTGNVVIQEVTSSGAAYNSGQVFPGDTLLQINGASITGMEVNEIQELLSGEPGTPVSIIVSHNPRALLPQSHEDSIAADNVPVLVKSKSAAATRNASKQLQGASSQSSTPVSLPPAPTKLVRLPVQSVGATVNDTVRATDDLSRTVDNLMKSLANSRLRSEAVVKNSGIVVENAPIQDAKDEPVAIQKQKAAGAQRAPPPEAPPTSGPLETPPRTPLCNSVELNTEAGSPEGSHVFRTVSDPESPSGKSLSELKLSFTTRMHDAIRMQRERMRVLLNDVDSKIVSLKKEHGLNEREVSDNKENDWSGESHFSSEDTIVSSNVPQSKQNMTRSAVVVEMNLRLDMDFQAAGQEGSIQRQIFIKDLKEDLADASGMGTSDFNILKVSPGSVVVDMNAPERAAQEIHRQSLDPNSRLRSGKVTRFTDKISLPRVPMSPVSADASPGTRKRDMRTEKLMEEMNELRAALQAVTGSITPSASSSGEALLHEIPAPEEVTSAQPGAEVDVSNDVVRKAAVKRSQVLDTNI
jgi:hypothetical protein